MARSARIAATARALREHFGTRSFTRADALVIGISHDRVERVCAAGLISRLGRGRYVAAAPESGVRRTTEGLSDVDRARLESLCAEHPGMVAAGRTAATIWGLPLPPSLGRADAIEVMAGVGVPGRRGRRMGAVVLRGRVLDHHLGLGPAGEPATDPLRTAIDLARGLPLHAALVPLDAAMGLLIAEFAIPPDVVRRLLMSHVADLGCTRGISAVARAARHAHPGAESALESIVRGRIIEAGLPTPRVQVPVVGASGRSYRADLGMDVPGDRAGSCRLLVEADGLGKYAAPEDLHREKRREVDLTRRGHEFVRVLYPEAVYEPAAFLADIASRLSRS